MSNTLAITNNTPVDFLIIDSTSSQGTTSTTTSAPVTLKQLPLTTGASAIKTGQTGTVTLNDTYVDPTTGQTATSLLYQLIPSTTDWFSPVANLGIMQNIMSGNYDPVTVTAAQYAAMQSAITFAEEIMAYPSSNLANGFNNAVNSAVSAANPNQTPTSASAVVDAYLQTTSDYKNVTFEMVLAAQAYMSNYPFSWTRKQASMTYYIYTANGTSPIASQGTVTMKKGSGTPKVSDSNGGYTITYTDAKNNNTPLYYQNGLFVDSTTSGTPNIALQGQLTLKSRLTGDASDNVIFSVLSGTLQGLTVMGFDTEQKTGDGTDTRNFFEQLFAPDSAQEAFNSFLQIGNALMILKEMGSGLGKLIQKIRGKTPSKPVTAKDLQALKDDIKADTEKMLSKKLGKNAKSQPTDVKSAEAEAKSNVATEESLSEKGSMESELHSEASELETLAEDAAPTQAMESDATSIRSEETTMENAKSPAQIDAAVKSEQPKIGNIESSLKSIETTEASKVVAQDKAELASQEKMTEEATADEAERAKESASTEEGDAMAEDEVHIE